MKRTLQLNKGAPPGFAPCSVIESINKSFSDIPDDDVSVHVIISTWFDGDVIGANVANCFRHGVNSVFILDNASPDDSRQQAELNGAVVAEVYETEFYDDDLRIRKENVIAEEIVRQSNTATTWVISLDADEFICGFDGRTVVDLLRRVPVQCSLIGWNAFDLYPDIAHGKEYRKGFHPAACMTHGMWRRGGRSRYCQLGHWKHVAIKYSNGKFRKAQTRGNHYPFVVRDDQYKDLYEPSWELTLVHAPIRAREHAYARLKALCGENPDGSKRCDMDDDVTCDAGAIRRYRHLDTIYAGDFGRVEIPHCHAYGRTITGFCPYEIDVVAKHITSDPGYSQEAIAKI